MIKLEEDNKKSIKFENLWENIKIDDKKINNGNKLDKHQEYLDELFKNQENFYKSNLLIILQNKIFNFNILKKLIEFNKFLISKNDYYFFKNDFLKLNFLNIFNILAIFIWIWILIIFLNTIENDLLIGLFKINTNFNQFLTILLPFIFLIYSYYKLITTFYLKLKLFLILIFWLLIFLIIFLIIYWGFNSPNLNFTFLIIIIAISIIIFISLFFYLLNILLIIIFNEIFGEVIFIFLEILIFLYYFLFLTKNLFNSNLFIIIITSLWPVIFFIKISFEINFFDNDYIIFILNNLKNKKLLNIYKFNFKNNWVNEIYFSIIPIVNFILIIINLISLTIYISIKLNNFFLIDFTDKKDIDDYFLNIFSLRELDLFLLNIFITLMLIFTLLIVKILKNKFILFLMNKLFIILFFIITFNSEIVFKNFKSITKLLNSIGLNIYFYSFIIFISFIPMISLKYINLINSFKFGLIFCFSINSIYFYVNGNFLSDTILIILVCWNYIPIIIIIIKFLITKSNKNEIKNGIKNTNLKKRNIFFLYYFSYVYDGILIFIMTVFIRNLSKGINNYVNLICFIYTLKIYVLMFINNLLKFKINFNSKNNTITKILNRDRKSKIIFIFEILVLLFLYILIMIVSSILKIPFSNYLVTFYSIYIFFIWFLYRFYLINLKKIYHDYIFAYNILILILFTLPFCFTVSLIYNINNFVAKNYILVNTYLITIWISFSLWGVIISFVVNLMLSQIKYEKMMQYICLKLKIDCFLNLVYSDINELREFADKFFEYKKKDVFSDFIKAGEFIIWWEYNKYKNYKKKLILKENFDEFLKMINEKYEVKPSFFEKLFCIKQHNPKKEIEIEIEEEELDNKNTMENNNIIINLVNKYNDELNKDFNKENTISNDDDDDLEEEKKNNINIFGNLIKDILVKKEQEKKDEKIKKFQNLFSKVNDNLQKNITNNLEEKIEEKIKNLNNLKFKKEKIDDEIENDWLSKKEEIMDGFNNSIKQQLDLYKDKNKLIESLKGSEEQDVFFLYLIYKNWSSKNENNLYNDKYSLTFTNFISFFKKIKMNIYFKINYNINIFDLEIINLKKLFINYAFIKRGNLKEDELIKLKKLQTIKNNKIRNLGMDFNNFVKYYKSISNKLSKTLDDYSVEKPFTKLILETYSLCKLCLYDFERIIKKVSIKQFKEELILNDEELIKKKKEMKRKNSENLNDYKNNLEKKFESEKNIIDSQIKNLSSEIDSLKKEKNTRISQNLIASSFKIINQKRKFSESNNKINIDDFKNLKKKSNFKNNNIDKILKNEKDESKNLSEENEILNSNEIEIKKEIKNKVKNKDKKDFITACFCIKINYNLNKNNDKKLIKKKSFLDKIYDFIFIFFYSLGLKDPDDLINYDELKPLQKEPSNWDSFSKYLIERVGYHKKIYDVIIYNCSILLNSTNIIFIITRVINIYSSYQIWLESTFPWFKDTQTTFKQTQSKLFYKSFGFKFGVSFGYSFLYFIFSLFAYQSIKNGTLGIDPKTGKDANFPHFQFFISIVITFGDFLINYCLENLSALFVCNSYSKTLKGYVNNLSETLLCSSDLHFLYLYLSFFGMVGFFFFALIFWPIFQFHEKLLDIKFEVYYVILDLFLSGLLIIIENFIDVDSYSLNLVLTVCLLEISVFLIKIILLGVFKPCIIKGYNYFELGVNIIESLPFFSTIILIYTRNSILSLIILICLILIILIFPIIYYVKKIKKNKKNKINNNK